MNPVEVFEEWGLLIFLGVDAVLFLVAILLWKPGSKPIAMGIGVFALTIPLAIIAVALDGVSTVEEPNGDDRIRRD